MRQIFSYLVIGTVLCAFTKGLVYADKIDWFDENGDDTERFIKHSITWVYAL